MSNRRLIFLQLMLFYLQIPKVLLILFTVGRAMRRSKGKEYGYIIVPIIVDEDEEGSIHKDFKQIINVISAMGMNDDRIIAEFQAMVFKQPRESNICDFDFESVSESINLKDFI